MPSSFRNLCSHRRELWSVRRVHFRSDTIGNTYTSPLRPAYPGELYNTAAETSVGYGWHMRSPPLYRPGAGSERLQQQQAGVRVHHKPPILGGALMRHAFRASNACCCRSVHTKGAPVRVRTTKGSARSANPLQIGDSTRQSQGNDGHL